MNEAFVATVLKPLLVTAVLPAAAAALGAAAARLGSRKTERSPWPVGLGLAAGLTAAFLLIGGRPSLPPRDVLHWVPIAVAAAWFLGSLDGLRRWPSAARVAAFGLLLAGLVATLLRPLAGRMEPGATALWGTALAAPAVLLWWLGDHAGRKQALPFALLPWMLSAGAFSGVMVLSGSAKSSQLGGALSSGLAALFLAALFGRLERVDGTPMAVAAAAWTGCLAHAQLYTEVHPACTALVALSAASSAWARVPLIGLMPKGRRLALGLLSALLPAAAAVLFAWSRFEPNPYAGY